MIISHKLNEVTAIADSVTIIRDGRTIETLDMVTDHVTEDRIIAGMVAAPSTTATRRTSRRSARRRCGSRTGRLQPQPAGPEGRGRGRDDAAPRGDRRAWPADGRRAYRAGDEPVLGARIGVHISARSSRTASRSRSARAGRDQPRHRLRSEDRKRYGLNLIQDIKTNISAAGSRAWPSAAG
ncbi:hypothetical protein [Nonomuraea rubra]|uniref:hypothetical protein n=1 Tax=Nonomuraea rubra TaxID=46180 RepID=UPI0031ED44C3